MNIHIARSRRYRWSDRQSQWGPFTFARASKDRTIGATISSGSESYEGCRVRVSALGLTLCCELPALVRPWCRRVKAHWDAETVARMGRDWYEDCHEREYGFRYSPDMGFLQVFLGRQTHDSSTTQNWCCHLPWTQWRMIRHTVFAPDGSFVNESDSSEWLEFYRVIEAVPKVSFAFFDFDGERITAATYIEEREWHFGTGWFRWLKWFRAPMIRRSLDIAFSAETGREKGSWKGGTTGHSIDMVRGESHESAFRRYCAEHNMTFIGPS